jgi:predicted extracellular nuclease
MDDRGGRQLSAARFRLGACLVAALVVVLAAASPSYAASPNLVISQIYGGGGNTSAPLTNDFIEIFNRSTSPVDLSGYSLQYTSATGTGLFGANSTLLTELPSAILQPGHYFLVQEAGGATGAALPAPDVVDSTPINMSATGGKVALATGTESLGCNGSTLPGCSPAQLARIVDLVGYDGANYYEGFGQIVGASAAPTLSNTTAAFRKNGGCTDTDNNGADFVAAGPAPRNSFSAPNFCDVETAPSVSSTSPADGAADVAADTNITITFSEPVTVTGNWYSILCGTSGAHTATVAGGPQSYTLDPTADFAPTETCTVTIAAAQVTDTDALDPPDAMAANYSFTFTIAAPQQTLAIHDIQGASHSSPYNGQSVTGVRGIVTAKRTNGYYMQDPNPDANDATSEGIFVFTSSAPTSVNVGDGVRVNGTVQEFRPGGSSTANLTTTELSRPTTTVLSTGNPLPPLTVVGVGGRIPPNQTIEDDATGDVETSGVFDPAQDGIDFWESMEGMRLGLSNAVAVGPTNAFGETPVVGDDGANAGIRTPRGGVLLRANDGNPERLILDDSIVAPGSANVGDHYPGSTIGVLDYNFGNFMLEVTSVLPVVHDGVQPESTTAAAAKQVAIATFNFENLDPGDPQSKFDRLAGILVNNLKAPDIVSGEEVQDDNGPTDNGVVSSDATLDKLVDAIQAAGGPHYDYRYINPVNDQDGGEPGGNIRQVFLFRTDRGVSFVARPGGGSTTATTVVNGASGPELSASPGRIDPNNSAWNASRKPLAGEFTFNGTHLFVIANHFNSKGGDDPLMGHLQPPTRSSEVQRHQQAQIVHDFVASILAADPHANVVVDGDLNDFEFSDTVSILKSGVLTDLMESLPENERYSYVFEGNSQTLDHILMSDALEARPFLFDVVHVNSEFADQASDHDPSVVRITLNAAPTVSAGGPYAVAEGSSVQLSATGSDPDGDSLTYAWDLDGNGTFETPGQNVTYTAVDGPATPTVKVRASDGSGGETVTSATVTITNIAPTVVSLVPSPTAGLVGEPVTFTGSATDPSSLDTAAGFTWAFDTGSGFGAFGANPFATTYSACGTYTVTAKARDKDGGISDPFTSQPVQVYEAAILPPLTTGAFNLVQRNRTVPVKLTIGCNGFASGLHPAISIRAGDYDPSVDPSDASYDLPDSSSAADTSGVMRESGGQYIYNLGLPSTAASGQLFTVLIRPFGGASPTLYAVLKVK